MTETEALSMMVAPSQRRPEIWRAGVLQIFITRACNLSCCHCTQGSNLRGKPAMITAEEFEQACISLEGYFGVVGMFGGNPTMHPDFPQLCEIMRRHISAEQRGLWSNNLSGHGEAARITFNPSVSNLNVHMDAAAYLEFRRDWPESRKFVKGLQEDSRHSPPYVALQDVIRDAGQRWELISRCPVNLRWSAMICPVPGKGLRAFFCELAGAQAMLHAQDPAWPDLGLEVKPGWWKQGMNAFAGQVRHYCHRCGIPLNRWGELAQGGNKEEVSETHKDILVSKRKNRLIELVTVDAGPKLGRMTDYIENGALK